MDIYEHRPPSPVLATGEAILWQGKPKRAAFIVHRTVAIFPLALFWFCFDYFLFIKPILSDPSQFYVLPFMLVHMFPVWLWLYNVITAGLQWKKTYYYVTTHRTIMQKGILSPQENSSEHMGAMAS